MRYLTFIIIAFFMSSCSMVSNWSRSEKVLCGVAVTGTLADALITERMLDTGKYKETNRFLGEHPSDGELGAYDVLFAAGFLTLAHYMPKYRKQILAMWGFINWYSAYSNYKLWRE